jgi:[acyl-carrier-protein] S-malonyltransferase
MCSDFLKKKEYKEIVEKIFEESDKILDYKISDIILKQSLENELNQTINTQPAIAINAEIIWNIFLKEICDRSKDFLSQISYFAGHSVGEYNALCAASIFDFRKKLLLLKERALAMQEASTKNISGMIAVLGVQASELECILCNIFSEKKIKLEIANDNSSEQIVLSGTKEAIDFFEENYKNYSIKKAIRLNVSGAFHSSLMAQAEMQFAQKINEILVEDNEIEDNYNHNFCVSQKDLLKKIPVISNVCATEFPIENLSEIKKLLCMQITSVVRWREIMDFVFAKNITKIIEIGPSPVLINLAKRHFAKNFPDKEINAFCISDDESMNDFFQNNFEIFFNN